MNEIVTKFLLAGDKFMPEVHLKQPAFTYNDCGSFTKSKEEYKNLNKHKIPGIYGKKLNKACFQQGMTEILQI